MKVKTSASEFRAIVQELTGRDSGLADAAKFKEIDAVDGPKILPDQVMKVTDDHVLEVPRMDPNRFSPGSSDSLFEPFDDVITPQMLENFAGFLRSNLVYESSQLM
ncbi:hypothetical protein HHK36_017874 [Tetracentron sinense]|uniref:VQ domain-containing protein n=1 Tax=Tetracentron sinense TaxID=13715 RepID=A0A835DDH2_TETSI|nr:hypothetical protein HHK36_017874 [Tetracentron sinense]